MPTVPHRPSQSSRSQLMERILQVLPDQGVFAVDAQGRIVSWNAGAQHVTGYAAEEVLDQHLSFLYPPEDVSLGAPARELTRAERHGRSDTEGWRARRDGRRIWVSASMLAVRDDAGALLGFARVERDDTERLRAEQELRYSEAKFSGMIAIATDAIVSTDEEQRIILFNRGAEEVFGYSAAEVMGEPLDLLLPERFRANHPAHVASFGRGEQTARSMGRHRSEISGRRKDGSEFPAEASISKLDVEGRRIYTAVLRDVSERHETERKIADLLVGEQQARAEAEAAGRRAGFLAEAGMVLSSSLDYETTLRGLASLVVPQGPDGCAIWMLEEASDGLRLMELVHPRASAEERERRLALPPLAPLAGHPAWEAVRAGQVVDYAPTPREDPRGLWSLLEAHRVLAAPIVALGVTQGVVAFIASDPRRLFGEGELALAAEVGRRAGLAIENARLYRQARMASQARDDMLHAVSHDLGNSLGAVMVATTVLGRTLPADTPPAARERLAGIRTLAEQMQRLRQDLLDAASVEAGRLQIDAEVHEAGALLGLAATTFGPVAEERGLTLEQVDPPAGATVLADGERVQQVLGNLLGNAFKFTPAGGRVTLGAEPHAEGVRFWVGDTGVGIDAGDLPHVFDRFWRSRESNRLGTGLGLAIARGIVEAHGGRMWVESRRGEGTTFSFVLPAGADEG